MIVNNVGQVWTSCPWTTFLVQGWLHSGSPRTKFVSPWTTHLIDRLERMSGLSTDEITLSLFTCSNQFDHFYSIKGGDFSGNTINLQPLVIWATSGQDRLSLKNATRRYPFRSYSVFYWWSLWLSQSTRQWRRRWKILYFWQRIRSCWRSGKNLYITWTTTELTISHRLVHLTWKILSCCHGYWIQQNLGRPWILHNVVPVKHREEVFGLMEERQRQMYRSKITPRIIIASYHGKPGYEHLHLFHDCIWTGRSCRCIIT